MTNVEEPMLWSVGRLAERWDISKEFVRRLIGSGELKSITMGTRRLVPLSEVRRAEQFGVGRLQPQAPKK